MILAGRIAVTVIGLILLGLAVFVYEDDEKKLQSKLIDWWVGLDDRRMKNLATERIIVARFSAFASRVLDNLFGPSSFSFRAAAISILASLTILGIIASLTSHFFAPQDLFPRTANLSTEVPERFIAEEVYYSALFVLAYVFAKRHLRDLSWLIVIVLALMPLTISLLNAEDVLATTFATDPPLLPEYYLGILVSTALDLTLISLARRVLRKAHSLSSMTGSLAISVSSLVIAFSVSMLPILLLTEVAEAFFDQRFPGDPSKPPYFLPLSVLVTFNLSDTVIMLAAFALVGFLFLHRALWPTLLRPLYALQRIEVFTHKKELCALAFGMIAAGLPVTGWAKSAFEIVKKLFGA